MAKKKVDPASAREFRPERKGGLRELDMGTVKRLLGYLKPYRVLFALVVLCIILNSIGTVASSLLIKPLIDDYIKPMLGQTHPDFTGLLTLIGKMIIVYALSAAAAWFYSRTMAVIAQNILNDIRCELFGKMQRLPIRYYDTHTHGELMSYFTNDLEAVRMAAGPAIVTCFDATALTVMVLSGANSVPDTPFTMPLS